MVIPLVAFLVFPGIVLSGYPPSPDCCPNKYPFLPAPPGHVPECAGYGSTFCETIDTYPTDVIRYLLYKWGRTYEPFIISETEGAFELKKPEPYGTVNYGYGGGYDYQPAPTYYPPVAYNLTFTYITPPPPSHYSAPEQHQQQQYQQQQQQHQQRQQQQYQQQQQPQPLVPVKQPQQQPQSSQPVYQYQNYQPSQPLSSYPTQSPQTTMNLQQAAAAIPPIVNSYWWNHRDSRNNQQSFPYLNQHKAVVKRQAAQDADQLCPVRTQFIVPQAAMNTEGNWMYVVNMQGDPSTRVVQKVKTETCTTSACNNVCTLAPGFRSSCAQKMVQKRLIALEATGERLVNELFWFPSCCVCEIGRV